jgi:hypothetical protein
MMEALFAEGCRLVGIVLFGTEYFLLVKIELVGLTPYLESRDRGNG